MLGISINRNKVNYISVKTNKNSVSIDSYGSMKYDSLNESLSLALKDILSKESLNSTKTVSFFIVGDCICPSARFISGSNI